MNFLLSILVFLMSQFQPSSFIRAWDRQKLPKIDTAGVTSVFILIFWLICFGFEPYGPLRSLQQVTVKTLTFLTLTFFTFFVVYNQH